MSSTSKTLLPPLLAIVLISCGYRPLLTRGENLKVTVPAVENATSHESLGARLTTDLRRKLSAYGVDVTSTSADAMRLEARIVAVSSTPGALTVDDGDLAAVDEAWTITVTATLYDPSGAVVWGEIELEGRARSQITGDVLGSNGMAAGARMAALEEVADRIVSIVLEGP